MYSYPGIVAPDEINQLMQATGRLPLTNAHPAAHTMTMRFFIRVAEATGGDINRGVALFTTAQMVFLSLACAYTVKTLRDIPVRRTVCYGVLAFYSLVPFMGVASVVLWKAVPFAGFMMLISCVIALIF